MGSNLGDRKGHLLKASELIEKEAGAIADCSQIYRTAAWGSIQQPAYYNQVLEVNTSLDPHRLLDEILLIEKTMGRTREKKWDPRIIDIDILYYNHQIINNSRLTVPHPQIPNRRFTLVPLCEIAPNFQHPALINTNLELLEDCKDPLLVEPLESKP